MILTADLPVPDVPGGLYTLTLRATSTGATTVRAVLAWTDPPGSFWSQAQLVHDLDLLLTCARTGVERFFPVARCAGPSVPDFRADPFALA